MSTPPPVFVVAVIGGLSVARRSACPKDERTTRPSGDNTAVRPFTGVRCPPAPTVSHRVNAERIVLLGWSRAILLQLAHPLVAAGVAEHSTFRGGPFAAARR